MKTSSYNLVMSAMFNGRRGERPPVGNPTSIVCHGLMDAAGVSFPEAHLDAGAMAELALAGCEILGFDTVMPEYSVQQEGAALGCDVDWGNRDRMPDNKNFPCEDFSDVVVPDHLLEKPSMKVVLEALSILRRQVGGKVAIVGKVMGPWTLSYHMAGTQNFLLQIGMGETEKVTKMLEQLMPEDLLKFGLIPEFIGRLPVITTVSPLDRGALVEILTEPRNALFKQYQRLFDMDGVELEFSDDSVDAIADLATLRGTGARGLRAIMEEVLLHVMYEVPSREDVEKVVISADVVNQNVLPTIVPREKEAPRKRRAPKSA